MVRQLHALLPLLLLLPRLAALPRRSHASQFSPTGSWHLLGLGTHPEGGKGFHMYVDGQLVAAVAQGQTYRGKPGAGRKGTSAGAATAGQLRDWLCSRGWPKVYRRQQLFAEGSKLASVVRSLQQVSGCLKVELADCCQARLYAALPSLHSEASLHSCRCCAHQQMPRATPRLLQGAVP